MSDVKALAWSPVLSTIGVVVFMYFGLGAANAAAFGAELPTGPIDWWIPK